MDKNPNPGSYSTNQLISAYTLNSLAVYSKSVSGKRERWLSLFMSAEDINSTGHAKAGFRHKRGKLRESKEDQLAPQRLSLGPDCHFSFNGSFNCTVRAQLAVKLLFQEYITGIKMLLTDILPAERWHAS
ncbi:hypothetical protein J6590_038279 [Homalodisca vitripennis]|nr:hypothetical protein J6590_038279 [Homalodisca vitripennis]